MDSTEMVSFLTALSTIIDSMLTVSITILEEFTLLDILIDIAQDHQTTETTPLDALLTVEADV